ncbi:uncharacterized protein LOC126897539 isoform X2 [Daktulosphaira vitifoliae]|uniref:uncharacterized protein LOC126897539 isoform X2 n=1 Tax=Daktulosphaira vitifoliae TaxID=58002 RepID=UPI0021AACF4D|nr:uncharacterized protein LOC126897539 isoform X2 [Daktulosphaira vitifoliae]
MDESLEGNTNIIRRSRKKIENCSTPPSYSSDLKSISVDQNNLNIEDTNNDCLTNIKQQQIYEDYLTPPKCDKTTATYDVFISNVVNSDNYNIKFEKYNKPVKVKSRWTRTCQMEMKSESKEILPTKNSFSKNNLLKYSHKTNSSDIIIESMKNTSIKNKISKLSIKQSKKLVKENGYVDMTNSFKNLEVKRKRGRPRKIIVADETSHVSDISNDNSLDNDTLIISNSEIVRTSENNDKYVGMLPQNEESTLVRKQVSDVLPNTAPIIKRGRGRPKKNSLTSIKHRAKKKLNNSCQSDISNDSELSKLNMNIGSELSDFNSFNIMSNNSILSIQSGLTDNISMGIKTDNFSSNIEINEVLLPYSHNKNIVNEALKSPNIDIHLNEILPREYEYSTDSKCTVKNCDENKYIFLELDGVNWNIPMSLKKSKSEEKLSLISVRRNSLSKNFKYSSLKNLLVENEDLKINKPWKSLSYLEGGPTQVEKCELNDLDKKFRTELKRSRSFPNCMLLDTVIWRYLVYQHNYEDFDEKYDLLTDSEINIINELPHNGFIRQIRSKSVPLELDENDWIKQNISYRSLDNLNKVLSTENSSLLPFDFSNHVDTIKNEEYEGKRRRSKRLTTKTKRINILDDEEILEFDDSKTNYLLLAEKIRQENEFQLLEARKTDPDLEKKLKILNFKLIYNNLYRPDRSKMCEYTSAEAQELRRLKSKATNVDPNVLCDCTYTKEDWLEGKPGCGEGCLNRLLNIECGSGCSLKSLCTNKQFQNKQFKRTQIVKTEDKGYGVCALEDISKGSFVDEYVGEVIDQHEMIRRMKKRLYKNNNYMVQLKHDEVIDATCKGNITRFINHSCEPNCIAEKWHVLGESRMGFFSSKNIKKGEEITFDYSFQIFGDAAQQKCYCGSSKCRGYISKKSRSGEPSSSDESDENDEDDMTSIKPEEHIERKNKINVKKITNKDKKRLRDLDKQLTDISNIKNKNRIDLEKATLNLNKLMVHITDTMSRSHILKFIREHDFNCKRLFMNFNGLSIIHTWMTSNNDENLKLDIIQTLSELPISNRNTITKSKVLDIVAEWANIPINIKNAIEKSEEHGKEVEKLLPDEENISLLMLAARILWKKWIILKMVFKIPKLERPKETITNNAVAKKPVFTQIKSCIQNSEQGNQYHFGKPITPTASTVFSYENVQNKLCTIKNIRFSENDNHRRATSMETFSKILKFQKQQENIDKNKAVFEWNKKHQECVALKSNKIYSLKESKCFIDKIKIRSNAKYSSLSVQQDIPTIGSDILPNKLKWNEIVGAKSTDTSLASSQPEKLSLLNLVESEKPKYFPIKEIVTNNKKWRFTPPTINDLHDEPILQSLLSRAPPSIEKKELKSSNNENANETINSFSFSLHIMNPENVNYEAQYPSIIEQNKFMQQIIKERSDKTLLNQSKECILSEKKSDCSAMIISLVDDISSDLSFEMLYEQANNNINKLFDKGLKNLVKSSGESYIDRSPIKISLSAIKKTVSVNTNLTSLFRNLKIGSHFYSIQPSNIIKIKKMKTQLKSFSKKKEKNVFRIKEKKTEYLDNTCENSSNPVFFYNEKLLSSNRCLNINSLYNMQTIETKNTNKLACKLLNGLNKKCSTLNKFTINVNSDTQLYTHNVIKEMDLYNKLVPVVKNSLCAKLKTNEKGGVINVFKQNFYMKYQNSLQLLKINNSLESEINKPKISISNHVKSNRKTSKRKLFQKCKPGENKRRIIDSNKTTKSEITIKDSDDVLFKKPLPPPSSEVNNFDLLQNSVEKLIPSTSLNSTSSTILSTPEIKQKPLMKCSPFNKTDIISTTEEEQNIKHLANSLCINYSTISKVQDKLNSKLIDPIVENFKSSIKPKKNRLIVDDPIVRDYLKRTQIDSLKSIRKCKLPESMMSLPVEVLTLIPDSQREMKFVIDFYHAMATVIVKVLDSYVKKSCKQGRIKNDEDFKYLAKKLNANILFKELQAKSVEDLKISESVKHKVELYIKKYMLKFGKIYRRKTSDIRQSQP